MLQNIKVPHLNKLIERKLYEIFLLKKWADSKGKNLIGLYFTRMESAKGNSTDDDATSVVPSCNIYNKSYMWTLAVL